MTETLQDKIDRMKPFPTLTEKILRTEVNKAIQELREEIEKSMFNHYDCNHSPQDILREVLALIGEKK